MNDDSESEQSNPGQSNASDGITQSASDSISTIVRDLLENDINIDVPMSSSSSSSSSNSGDEILNVLVTYGNNLFRSATRPESEVFSGRSESRSNTETDTNGVASCTQQPSEGDTTDDEDPVEFDIQLPCQHLYLGTNLCSVPGHSFLEEGSIHNLPLLSSKDFNGLFAPIPGQIVPLRFLSEVYLNRMRQCLVQNVKTFGFMEGRSLLNICHDFDHYYDDNIGVIFDIVEFNSSTDEFCIKARVTQRFKLIDKPNTKKNSYGVWLVGPAFILPETVPEDPLRHSSSVQTSLNKIRRSHRLMCESREAALTHWPCFVYKQFECKNLVDNIRSSVEKLLLVENKHPMNIPDDPIQLSYWALSNLPFNSNVSWDLLQTEIIERLRQIQSYIQEWNQALTCNYCFGVIAYMKHIFQMSASGPQGTYVNPNGYIHDILTVHEVQDVFVDMVYSTADSWFPGYAWYIAHCAQCKIHVGWKYIAVKRGLVPKTFYGITKRSVNTTRKLEGRII